LIWGVNDYDEVATMSFAIDLVRLSASAEFASEIIPDCELTLSEICEVVRDGYIAGLEGQASHLFWREDTPGYSDWSGPS